jgi:hypothetical protein
MRLNLRYLGAICVLLCALACAPPVFGQGAVLQSGPVTQYHPGSWQQNGILQDGGTTGAPFLNSLGLFGGPSCPFGISSQTTAGTPGSSPGLLTFCQTSSLTTLSTNTPLTFIVQGVSYPFPFGGGGGGVTGPGTSVVNDLACWNNVSGTLLKDCTALPNGAALGTPASGVLTNATGYQLANLTGLGAGLTTSLALSPSGTGAVCLINGCVLTNATGYQVANLAGLGTGVAAALALPPSGTGSICLTSGSSCTGGGGGSGTVNSGTLGQVAYYASAGTAVSGIGPGTTSTVLHGNASGAPSYSQVSLATDISGNLPVANLNSGSNADSSHVWRGDASWATFVASVTSGSANLTCSPTTGSVICSASYIIRAVTGTTDALVAADGGKLVTYSNASAIAVTIAQATGSFGAGYSTDVQNLGAGLITITPATSTINGAATLTIPSNTGCSITSDGANYQVNACTALASSNGGTFTANGATAVVVSNTHVSANSVITMSLKTVGGTPAGAPFLSAVTPGTGFSVKAVAGDTSVYNYQING